MEDHSSSSKHDIPETFKPSIRKATFPFDEGDADVTLRTSDNVEFRVHRVILSLASSVFKDMFSMPQPLTGENDSIPVAEDDETLDTLLRICYPTVHAKPASLVQIRKVLAAAMKYDAPLVVDRMRDALMAPEFLDAQPLVVFTIACVFHLEEVAQTAAEMVVTMHNFMVDEFGNTSTTQSYPKLDDVSAGAYFRLLQLYRTRTAITQPPAKRRKGRSVVWNSTPTRERYVVNFEGIAPFCRPPPTPTLPPTKSQVESVSDPFTDTTGDLILRTSDGLDFYVHRNILTFASPTFLSGLVPAETEGKPSGPAVLPVYQVQESAAILDVLLRVCYPVPHLQPADPDTFLVVLSAAHKYGMSKARQILRGGWLELVEASPMRLYFAAVELGWKKEAKACADQLASLSVSNVHAFYVPEMESIGSAPYRNLLAYVSSKKSTSSAQLGWVEGACGVPSC
ncbi:hypothetical protein LXA43DRAFT_519572 [Ganoderma leucocontextum]|nr:hypothetical protein LXA43DRAFT_519572 [Ganoderma leucocontextum]